MALGRKTGGRDWKPGESGNPAGKKPMSPEAKTFRQLTKTYFRELSMKYLFLTEEEMREKAEDENTPMLDKIVINILLVAHAGGDMKRLEFFLDRIIGKVPDKIIDETEKRDININIKKWNQEK